MAAQPSFAEGSDTTAVKEALSPLLSVSGGRWALTADGQGIERSFKFKTFAKTWVSRSSACREALIPGVPLA